MRSRSVLLDALVSLFGPLASLQSNDKAKAFYHANRPRGRYQTTCTKHESRYSELSDRYPALRGTRGAIAGFQTNPKKYGLVGRTLRRKSKLLGTRG